MESQMTLKNPQDIEGEQRWRQYLTSRSTMKLHEIRECGIDKRRQIHQWTRTYCLEIDPHIQSQVISDERGKTVFLTNGTGTIGRPHVKN